jgi:hypothetical protein
MTTISVPRQSLDLRTLASTREISAYRDGGLFPVLASVGNAIVAALRSGAGHVGLAGRVEIVRSLDAGHTWTPPNVIADSDRDDRNIAFGASPQGTLVLAYHRQGSYDEAGNYRPDLREASGKRPVDVMITRSHDAGLTWTPPAPLGVEAFRTFSPYGKIVTLADGALLLPLYGPPIPALTAEQATPRTDRSCSYLLRSRDDGATWGEPSLIAVAKDETALAALPTGDLLAVLRGSDTEQALWSARSTNGGATWSAPEQITPRFRHPADLLLLSNGDLLLTYGNRTPPYRIEGRLSRDGGHSWLDCLLTFSGHLYGYTVEAPRPYDLGYPSSAMLRAAGRAQGVTMYYYNPSLNRAADWQERASEARYLGRDYQAVAVTWDEAELIAAVTRLTG